MARRRNKGEERGIAEDRIARLLALAAAAPPGGADRADRYAHLAQRVAERYQTGLPAWGKARVCRACGAFLVPGRTSRTRIGNGRVTTTCLRCGHMRRRPTG